MLARLAPAVVLLTGAALLIIPSTAAAVTQNVAIIDDAFSPPTVTVQQGSTVHWQNNGQFPHTTTSFQGFWDSGTLTPTNQFSQPFPSAGTFTYQCTIHHFRGTVKVPLAATGSAAGGWKLRWSSAASTPDNRAFDVQLKRPGSATWQAFRTHVAARNASFNPARNGTYRFRARTDNLGNGKHSDWSPVRALSIT